MPSTTLFLHGLDSSSKGTKGRYFTEYFPDLIAPDFTGSLRERLQVLETICKSLKQMVMIGSSLGGLMATCFAIAHPKRVQRLILLAPALNFPEFSPPAPPLHIPTLLIIGRNDTVTPSDLVIPAARATFENLEIRFFDDDHLLRTAFSAVDWQRLLA
jgi:pimeloyl-ACP methyl ester carboxylesterase